MAHLRTLAAVAAVFFLLTPALAEPGDPIAIRWWGGGHVTIESFDDLVVSIDPSAGHPASDTSADLVLLTHGPATTTGISLRGGADRVVPAIDDAGQHQPARGVLDRDRGKAAATWTAGSNGGSPRSITVRAIPAERDETLGDERGRTGLVVIEVDGVRIVHAGGLGQSALRRAQIEALGGGAEILILPTGPHGLDGLAAARILRQLGPRVVIPIGTRLDGPDDHAADGALIARFLPSHFAAVHRPGNTLVIYKLPPTVAVQPAIVTLRSKPHAVPAELHALLTAKEAAARRCAAAIAGASAAALNRGDKDTPPARWDAEVVRAQELAWMSVIMQRVDTWMPAIDHIPAAGDASRHPKWTGAEEGLQISHVQAFTRRYAGVLAGLDLDEPLEGAPAEAPTLRKVLTTLTAAYDEHGRLAAAKLSTGA